MIDFALAKKINTQINEATCYQGDLERVGQVEFWDVAVGSGDCEDYALAKRAALLSSGVSIDDLFIVCCWTETGGYHAVLLVSTTKGDMILDNRYPLPMPKDMLDYRWDKIQKGNKWYELS